VLPKDVPPVPFEVLQIIKCGCSAAHPCSTGKCSCVTAQMSCSMFCKCYAGPECNNVNTRTVFLQDFDNDEDDHEYA
jgi:hypothetical protein